MRHIALIGLRCTGKTSVGAVLARMLGVPFTDVDVEIARNLSSAAIRDPAAQPPPTELGAGEWLSRIGEAAFRDAEELALAATLEQPSAHVIATGGGVVERPRNCVRLEARATCVWLRAPVAELERRLGLDPRARPALLGVDAAGELAELERRRAPLYRGLSQLAIDCEGQSIEAVANRIAGWLRPGGTFRRGVDLGPGLPDNAGHDRGEEQSGSSSGS